MMRKTYLVFLGAVAGAAVALLVNQPHAILLGSAARAAAKPKQPVLYVEFRKDGTPIDPGPWWATNEGEKVRG